MFKKITNKNTRKLLSLVSIATASLTMTNSANATIVEFQTSQGNFKVNLFDQTTPKTVENFLSYVNSGHYTNSIVHRVARNFVVQGGGYEFEGSFPLKRLAINDPVINEPIYSNVQGTIAMAKIGSDVNSATDQWFFNLVDSSANLDLQNGGFTVFGQIVDDPNDDDDGMAVVNKIALLNLCNTTNLSDVPVVLNAGQACNELIAPGIENFVVIEAITIVDSSEVTDSDLTPLLSTNVKNNGTPEVTESNDSGGTTTWFTLIALTLLTIKRRLMKR